MTTYRRHGRTAVRCEVKLKHETLGEMVAETVNLSVSGLFVKSKELVEKVAIGDAVKAELENEVFCFLPPQALTLKVVRLTGECAALAQD